MHVTGILTDPADLYVGNPTYGLYCLIIVPALEHLTMTESCASSRLPSNGESMCVKCNEFDSKIAHYQRIAIRVTDQQTLEGIAGLIKQMTADKAAIRCEPDKK